MVVAGRGGRWQQFLKICRRQTWQAQVVLARVTVSNFVFLLPLPPPKDVNRSAGD